MSFEKRFDDESKKFRKDKNEIINKRNQKINLIKKVKKMFANLMKNKIEQIKKILLKMIEMLKVKGGTNNIPPLANTTSP